MAPSRSSYEAVDISEIGDTYLNPFIGGGEVLVVQDKIAIFARLAAMTVIFFVSLFAVSLPTLSKRLSFLRIPRIIFFAGKHFGTGIILSTAFCHLLQDAFHALYHPAVEGRSDIGNRTGLVVLSSLLSIFLVEYLSTAYVNCLQAQPSAPQSLNTSPVPSRPSSPHFPDLCSQPAPSRCQNDSGPATPFSSDPSDTIVHTQEYIKPTESTPLLSAPLKNTSTHSRNRSKSFSYGSRPDSEQDCDTLFFEGHHRHERRGTHDSHHLRSQRRRELSHDDHSDARKDAVQLNTDGTGHNHGKVVLAEVKVGKKRQVVGILVLQLGIMIHSLVIGLTLSIVSTEFASLVTAIIFHQLFEGLSLGIRIASLPTSREGESKRFRFLESTLSILFAVTTPVGILLGLVSLSKDTDSGRMKLTQGLMSAISAGMLIYSACVEMLAGDFIMDTMLWKSSVWKQALALVSLFAGVAVMAVVGK